MTPASETLLYPQQYGKLYIEQSSMTVIAQIITQAPQTGSLFDNFFGGEQNIEEVRKNISAAPIQITVKNFPSGAPASFKGNSIMISWRLIHLEPISLKFPEAVTFL